MRPELDGDPRNPPRFRRPPGVAAKDARAQSGFSPPENSSAGATGFDSTNARKKAKTKANAKAKASAGKKAELPPHPGSFGAVPANPYTQQKLAVPRPTRGAERRSAAPYGVIHPPTPPDAPPLRRRVIPEETPFDPVGVQVGAFNFKPAIDLVGGYDTNPARSLNPTAVAVFSDRAGAEIQFELAAARVHRRSARQLYDLRENTAKRTARASTASSTAASTSPVRRGSISKAASRSAPTTRAARTSRPTSRGCRCFSPGAEPPESVSASIASTFR